MNIELRKGLTEYQNLKCIAILGMFRLPRRLCLTAGIGGGVLVKCGLACSVAEVVDFAFIFGFMFGGLLIHFHSANRILGQQLTLPRTIYI